MLFIFSLIITAIFITWLISGLFTALLLCAIVLSAALYALLRIFSYIFRRISDNLRCRT